MPSHWEKVGTVIAESDECVGVRLDGVDVPVIIRKVYLGVVLT
jgi:hypothetical protein